MRCGLDVGPHQFGDEFREGRTPLPVIRSRRWATVRQGASRYSPSWVSGMLPVASPLRRRLALGLRSQMSRALGSVHLQQQGDQWLQQRSDMAAVVVQESAEGVGERAAFAKTWSRHD